VYIGFHPIIPTRRYLDELAVKQPFPVASLVPNTAIGVVLT
jgi:hypothetical protein